MFRAKLVAASALILALSACGGNDAGNRVDTNALDAALAGNLANDADPALTSALADQIMVDPNLAQSSNRNAIRAPDGPATSPIPPDVAPGGAQPAAPVGALKAPPPTPAGAAGDGTTLGALAAAQAAGKTAPGAKRCDTRFDFSTIWATRLPRALPVYPGGRVTEGAGSDRPGCRVALVSFVSDAPLQQVIDWYYTQAIRAGYTAEHQISADKDHILAGTRARDDGAYYLLLADQGGKTQVDIIASEGN